MVKLRMIPVVRPDVVETLATRRSQMMPRRRSRSTAVPIRGRTRRNAASPCVRVFARRARFKAR